jgi:hypothetical protein
MFNPKWEKAPPLRFNYPKRLDGAEKLWGRTQFLIWGMTLLLGGCSAGFPLSLLLETGYVKQFMPMVGTIQSSLTATTSDSENASDDSPSYPGNPESSSQKSKPSEGSKKSRQQASPSQQKPSILVPEIPDQDNGQVIGSYKSKIEETQTMIRTINESQLTKEQHDTLISIHSFLEKAQEAFSQDDMPMAVNLAEKAHTLTKEIVKNSMAP